SDDTKRAILTALGIPCADEPQIESSLAADRFSIVFASPALTTHETSAPGKFSLYPNPTSGKFFVGLKDVATNAKVIVHNAQGQEIPTEAIIDGSHKIPVTPNGKLPAGVYFVEVVNNGVNTVSKLLVE
ncbi:MAG: T9SS type A sorting domain-containing protein, partial [Chitinophagaceae bacterium]